MELNEAKEILNKAGFIVENTDTLQGINSDKKDIIAAFKAIKSMAGKSGWEFEEDSNPNDFFTVKEITDGTLERVIKQNKGFTTVMIEVRKTLNDFGYFVELELVVTPQGKIEVLVKDNKRVKRFDTNVKRFDVTEYQTAIKYAKWVH